MLNCDYMQGYFFGTPMEMEEIKLFSASSLLIGDLDDCDAAELVPLIQYG